MSHIPTALTPATLAILSDLAAGRGARGALPVTASAEPATTPAGMGNDFNIYKSDTYIDAVTRAHALPSQALDADTWEERTAIIEHDGGHTRQTAERLASLLLVPQQMDGPGAQMCALDRALIEADRRRG